MAFINIDVVESSSWKPSVSSFAALPMVGNATGDARVTLDTYNIYVWDGDSWEIRGSAPISGLNVLNGQSGATQTFALPGTLGTEPNWVSASDIHTLNIPLASTSSVNAGLISNTEYNTFNNKQPAGNYITDLTGDVTASGPGSVAATIANNAVTNGKFRQSSGLSIVGRSSNSTGDVADITASSDNTVLQRSGTSLVFASVPNSALANSSITILTGSSGSDFNISGSPVSLGGSLTINIPDAGASTRGLINTGTQTISGAKTFSGLFTLGSAVRESVVALTDSATISVNAALGNIFTVTLGGNRTLGNPSNVDDGQKFIFRIRQDAIGGRTLSYDTKYRFSDTIPSISLSTNPNTTDYIGVIYNEEDDTFDIVAFSQGYA